MPSRLADTPALQKYGPHADQVGELSLARDPGAPLLILLHGGFWRMPYDRSELEGVAADLRALGYSTWNVGYRRVGTPGGGWPGTAQDVLDAVAHVPFLPAANPRALALIGFSAGGHLALWAASELARQGRHTHPPLRAAIALAPIADLVAGAEMGLGDRAVVTFLGGGPREVPERYAAASPRARLPLGVRQVVIHGSEDAAVPVGHSRGYAETARRSGDEAELIEVKGGTHLDHLDPASEAHQRLRGWLTRHLPPR